MWIGVQFLAQAAVFFIVFLNKGLSLWFMCSDQHVKYWIPCRVDFDKQSAIELTPSNNKHSGLPNNIDAANMLSK